MKKSLSAANRPPVCVVTGGTSGIGLATVRALLARGCTVYTLSRREGGEPGARHMAVDVTDEAAVQRAAAQILQEAGGVDVVVNNAGFGISGAVEFTDTAAAIRQLDVNFFGAVRVNRAFLPAMRAQGRGRLIQISSVAAVAAIPFQTYYSVSKAALNAYTLALENEVRPYGVSVCAVMPGDIRTGFTAARDKNPAGNEAYDGRIGRSVARMERDEETGMEPAVAGAFIARVALRRRVRPLYTIGLSYQLLHGLIRLLPVTLVNRLVGALYGGGRRGAMPEEAKTT